MVHPPDLEVDRAVDVDELAELDVDVLGAAADEEAVEREDDGIGGRPGLDRVAVGIGVGVAVGARRVGERLQVVDGRGGSRRRGRREPRAEVDLDADAVAGELDPGDAEQADVVGLGLEREELRQDRVERDEQRVDERDRVHQQEAERQVPDEEADRRVGELVLGQDPVVVGLEAPAGEAGRVADEDARAGGADLDRVDREVPERPEVGGAAERAVVRVGHVGDRREQRDDWPRSAGSGRCATSTWSTGPSRNENAPETWTKSEIWRSSLSAETPMSGVPSKSSRTGSVVVPVRTS